MVHLSSTAIKTTVADSLIASDIPKGEILTTPISSTHGLSCSFLRLDWYLPPRITTPACHRQEDIFGNTCLAPPRTAHMELYPHVLELLDESHQPSWARVTATFCPLIIGELPVEILTTISITPEHRPSCPDPSCTPYVNHRHRYRGGFSHSSNDLAQLPRIPATHVEPSSHPNTTPVLALMAGGPSTVEALVDYHASGPVAVRLVDAGDSILIPMDTCPAQDTHRGFRVYSLHSESQKTFYSMLYYPLVDTWDKFFPWALSALPFCSDSDIDEVPVLCEFFGSADPDN